MNTFRDIKVLDMLHHGFGASTKSGAQEYFVSGADIKKYSEKIDVERLVRMNKENVPLRPGYGGKRAKRSHWSLLGWLIAAALLMLFLSACVSVSDIRSDGDVIIRPAIFACHVE